MAAIVNARDVLLQAAGTRLVTITLPSNTPADWSNIIGAGKPSDNADVTVTAVNGGLTVTGGGITLSGGGSIKGGQTAYATGTGFFLGYSSTAYKFSIGSSTAYLRWTGTALEIAGNFTGASSIDITGTAKFRGAYSGPVGSSCAVFGNEGYGSLDGVIGITNAGAGVGVRGDSSGTGVNAGIGVVGTAASTGLGVSGYAASGTGVMGESGGASGTGVLAKNASGGNALYSQGTSVMLASAPSVNALTCTASQSSSSAAKFFNTGAAKEVWLCPTSYAAYSPSGGGKQYFIDGAGPFTGFHPGLGSRGLPFTIGDILIDDEILFKPDVSNALGTMVHSTAPAQRGVIGVLSDIGEIPPEVGSTFDYALWWELALEYQWLDANGVGEGLVNVCGEGGDIAKGDLIVTSSIPGKGMRQADDIVRSYTVAKARESMTFQPGEVKQIACIYLCG